MADNEPEKDHCKVVERRYRIVLDVPIRIDGIKRRQSGHHDAPHRVRCVR